MSTDITFCTNMVNAGIDLKSLQYLMGHSDVKVTLDVYTLTDGKEQAAAENGKSLAEKRVCEA